MKSDIFRWLDKLINMNCWEQILAQRRVQYVRSKALKAMEHFDRIIRECKRVIIRDNFTFRLRESFNKTFHAW